MTIRLKGWSSILFTLIILNITLNGNLLLGEEKRVISLVAVEGETFSYTFEGPSSIIKPKWKNINELPLGLKLSKTGVLYGMPKISVDHKGLFVFDVDISGKSSDDLSKTKTETLVVKLQIKRIPLWTKAEKLRAFAGIEQSGASSAQPEQKIVVSLYHSTPFPLPYKQKTDNEKNYLGKPLRLWQSIRFSSIPLQLTSSLVDIPETFKKEVSKIKVNELVRSVEFTAGLDLRILKTPRKVDHKTRKIYTLNLVGAYGFSTPLSTLDATRKFKLTDESRKALIDRYREDFNIDISGNLEGKGNVAFVEPDRKNFLRQWYVGLRFKSYTKPVYNKKDDEFLYKFPTFFEISIGRNDVIVKPEDKLDEKFKEFGSSRRKMVLRFDGQFSFKLLKIPLYFFGTAMIQFNKEKKVEPIVLEPALNVPFPGEDIGQVVFPDEDRDYYRFGIGVDVMEMANAIFSGESNSNK